MLKTIRLTPEDVKHFVDVASKCDFDIEVNWKIKFQSIHPKTGT